MDKSSPLQISIYKGDEVATELGHRLTPFRDGVSYCLHKDCGGTVKVQGSLPDLVVTGSAVNSRCPYRGIF